MKGFKLNPNKKYVNIIMEGLQKKDGHCPCRLNIDDSTLCPCDDFIKNKNCKCKLYIPIEPKNLDKEEKINK